MRWKWEEGDGNMRSIKRRRKNGNCCNARIEREMRLKEGRERKDMRIMARFGGVGDGNKREN